MGTARLTATQRPRAPHPNFMAPKTQDTMLRSRSRSGMRRDYPEILTPRLSAGLPLYRIAEPIRSMGAQRVNLYHEVTYAVQRNPSNFSLHLAFIPRQE